MSGIKMFECTDILNRTIILTSEQYNKHIIEDSGHIEMLDDPTCIERTIINPDKIFLSSTHSNRQVYFSKGEHKDFTNEYVKVVVAFSCDNQGNVVTSFVSDNIKGSIGAVIYEKAT